MTSTGHATPRRAALANLLLPGTGYLLVERRVLFGGILLAYTMTTIMLALLFLSILFAHFPHVHPDGYPAIFGSVLLFAFQHACVAIGTAIDGHWEARRAAA